MAVEPGADILIFALVVGTALFISALPMIAKILMDLNPLRTEMGHSTICWGTPANYSAAKRRWLKP